MFRSERLRLVAGLLAMGLAAPAFADPSAPATQVPQEGAAPPTSSTSTAPTNPEAASSVEALRKAWMAAKKQIFAGKMTKPDSEDPDTVNHLTWYEATDFVRPYPGETTVRPPSDFKSRFAQGRGDDDD